MYSYHQRIKEVLLANGFIDITSERNKLKGKAKYKSVHPGNRYLLFDYCQIIIVEGSRVIDCKPNLSDTELKALIFYFSLPLKKMYSYIMDNHFTIDKFLQSIEKIKEDISENEELGISRASLERLKDKLRRYENMIIKIPLEMGV